MSSINYQEAIELADVGADLKRQRSAITKLVVPDARLKQAREDVASQITAIAADLEILAERIVEAEKVHGKNAPVATKAEAKAPAKSESKKNGSSKATVKVAAKKGGAVVKKAAASRGAKTAANGKGASTRVRGGAKKVTPAGGASKHRVEVPE